MDEMTALTYYALFTMALIAVQATAATVQRGLMAQLGPHEDLPKLTGMAGRLDRAQWNSIAALAMFAPAVLMLQKMGYSTPATLKVCFVFLIARIVYALAYAFNISGVRSAAWGVGFICTGWLYCLAGFWWPF
jgi:uncharacterized MAPEG superfamily protein